MAEMTQKGIPNKSTAGNIGDICTNSNTGKRYELVASYTTSIKNQPHTEYEWREIKTSNSGSSVGGDGKQYVYI